MREVHLSQQTDCSRAAMDDRRPAGRADRNRDSHDIRHGNCDDGPTG
jgi:hypothetical protein